MRGAAGKIMMRRSSLAAQRLFRSILDAPIGGVFELGRQRRATSVPPGRRRACWHMHCAKTKTRNTAIACHLSGTALGGGLNAKPSAGPQTRPKVSAGRRGTHARGPFAAQGRGVRARPPRGAPPLALAVRHLGSARSHARAARGIETSRAACSESLRRQRFLSAAACFLRPTPTRGGVDP